MYSMLIRIVVFLLSVAQSMNSTWGQNRVGQLGYPNRFNTEEPVDGAHCFSTPQVMQ